MSTFAGTGKLARLALRRDRWTTPLWVLTIWLFPSAFIAAFDGGFPTAEARQEYAETSIHNTAFTVMYGPIHGSSLGELVAWRSGFVAVVIAVISLLVVIRHTRTEEEAGRRELIGSAAVGRHAGLAAALLVTCAANLVMGALVAIALAGQGLPVAGSVALGLGLASAGWSFAAIGAVAAQLTSGAGAARGIAILTLGVTFLIRSVGDISGVTGGGLGWLSWLSPIGWAHGFRPFSENRWWVLVVVVVAFAGLTALAASLSSRRDLGSGLVQPRPGPAVGAPGLRSPFALAWRLHRGSLVSRTAGFAAVGLVLGGIAKSIGDLLDASSPSAAAVLERLGGAGAAIDQYLVGMMTLLGLVAAAFAIQSALQLRTEEASGRAEALLATPVDRIRWAGSHLFFALAGPTLGVAVGGAAIGLAHGLNTGDVGRELPRILGAALVQLPAAWVFAGLAFALFGLLPRLAAGAFVVMLTSLLLGWAGAELGLGQWVVDLSVFGHVPQLPGGEMHVVPLVVLTAAAAALGGLGLLGLRRRDMPVG